MSHAMRGVITTLVANRGFGFIRGDDHISRFFHARDVEPDMTAFDTMRIGQGVQFEPIEAEKGPRAIQVRPDAADLEEWANAHARNHTAAQVRMVRSRDDRDDS